MTRSKRSSKQPDGDHASVDGDPAQGLLDALVSPDDDGGDDTPGDALPFAGGYPCVSRSLASHCLRAVLPADIQRRIKSGQQFALVVQAPGPDWCDPLGRVLAPDPTRILRICRDGSSRYAHRPADGNDDVAAGLADGRAVVGVSHAPAQFLPATLMSAADAHVAVQPPDSRILRAVLRRHACGRIPDVPDGIAAALSFTEIAAAFRAGASARDVVANLVRMADRKTQAGGAGDAPPLSALHYEGDALAFAEAVAADVSIWRDDPNALPWASVTSRALLTGRPGVGKTLLARALASTLGAPLTAVSCGELFTRSDGHLSAVLQGLQRSIDAARAGPLPSVVLLDEFEALCPSRASMDSRNREYFTVVTSRLLTLLDGAASGAGGADDLRGVVILAATNYPDRVDEAAFRRLHRVVEIRPPSCEGLGRVLRFHLGNVLPGADLTGVARLAPAGATPAQAARWVRDALRAARTAGRDLAVADLAAVVAPPEDRDPDDRRTAAVHEAGHAIAYLAAGRAVAAVSIVAHGGSGGHTRAEGRLPTLPRRADLDDVVVPLLAGRAAEDVLLGAPSTGAEGDLATATGILADAHARQGLGDRLTNCGDPSAALAYDRDLRAAVEADLRRLYARALALVRRRRAAVERVAEALLERRFLAGDQVAALAAAPRARARRPRDDGGNP
ncbi:MAG TPA: AAA family ATPase [Methylocystis sp.]|jgi:DNA polymerase III delta prime subunit